MKLVSTTQGQRVVTTQQASGATPSNILGISSVQPQVMLIFKLKCFLCSFNLAYILTCFSNDVDFLYLLLAQEKMFQKTCFSPKNIHDFVYL